jgi:hypothetical protein
VLRLRTKRFFFFFFSRRGREEEVSFRGLFDKHGKKRPARNHFLSGRTLLGELLRHRVGAHGEALEGRAVK